MTAVAPASASSPDPFNRADSRFNTLEGWTWVGTYGGYYLQCDLISDFEHGFFTRLWQERDPEVLAGVVSAGVSVHRLRQIHSAVVVEASRATTPWPEADGLVSDGEAQSLWVCGADCTPVMLADPASGRVATCHAGWRGVAGRILAEAVARLAAEGSDPAHLRAALGPAIAVEHYQVEREVSEAVAASIHPSGSSNQSGDPEGLLQPLREGCALLPDPQEGRDRLDIRRAARLQLVACGVPESHISLCPLCTASERSLFHSWRRDQVKAVQWSGIVSQA